MQGFAKILLGSAAAVALVSAATVLSTTEASAQFPNIDGIMRGLSHPYYGGSKGYHSRGKAHESKSDHHSKEAKEEGKSKQDKDAKEEDKGKQDSEDKQNKQSAEANQGNHSNKAEDKGPPQSSPPANNSTPKQPVAADVPSLTPER